MPERGHVIYDIERCIGNVLRECSDCSKYEVGVYMPTCMEHLLADARELLEDQPRWIPVEEKLPEDPTDCLVYDGSQVQFCSYYCGTWNTPDCYESQTIDGVTHWMPLPRPPEGE